MIIFIIIAVSFVGWNLGANDASNIFGTIISNKILKFKTAGIIGTIFVILGAVIGGKNGIETYNSLYNGQDLKIALAISFAAGISVLIMTIFKIPVSTTHSILSGIVVSALISGNINVAPLFKIFTSWFLSPIGAMGLGYIIYKISRKFIRNKIKNVLVFNKFIKILAILIGIYGSYSLGANNVANVVGIFAKGTNFSINLWLILGGISISFGLVTYSKRVMKTVGLDIVYLDNYGALVAVLASAIVIHLYSVIGVPVSSSQAIVGGVIGVGMTESVRNINYKIILKIVSGWIYSILISGFLTFIFIKLL
ncbi:inorganic phosphate transporter [Haliovirga abyssi]|uniref:Anion permease n=1 Tax=Haliovirga abyssi TaxID=2996794 RepID=A0AAU9DBP3_9FUSO|nr:inorganic phosphate transporter [Haliovirga abyssi]BDU50695.1 anion permease [Haliovirga abyssi]